MLSKDEVFGLLILVLTVLLQVGNPVEARDSLNVTLLSRYETGGSVNDMFVSRDYAFLADSTKGLVILNVQDPRNPYEVNSVNSISAHALYMVDSLVYVVGKTVAERPKPIFCIYNISNPPNPQLVSSYNDFDFRYSWPWDIFVSGSYAYVAEELYGLEIIDIQKSEAPSKMTDFEQWCNWSTINVSFVREPFAFVAGQACFSIFYVEDKVNPLRVSEIEMGGQLVLPALDLIVIDNLAYVAHLEYGLVIIDVTHVIAPSYLYASGYGPDLNGAGIDVMDNYAYLGTENKGLRIFDITDPSAPVEVGFYETEGKAGRVIVRRETIFLASGSGGLYILQNELLTSLEEEKGEEKSTDGFHLYQNYPNPFNVNTDIRYQLLDIGSFIHTTLKIYNLLGQEVRNIVDEWKKPGVYTITWNGRDNVGDQVASGVYFYRITAKADGTKKWTETKKLLLMR